MRWRPGRRLAAAVRSEFQRGAKRVFLVGGDCPRICHDYFADADRHLDEADLVIGPATDGGYVLLGLKDQHIGLFENIAWSTHAVLERTLANASRGSLSIELLPNFGRYRRCGEPTATVPIPLNLSLAAYFTFVFAKAGEKGGFEARDYFRSTRIRRLKPFCDPPGRWVVIHIPSLLSKVSTMKRLIARFSGVGICAERPEREVCWV